MDDGINTLKYFDEILNNCKELFMNKSKDYGPTWVILRWNSLVDQIWIKAKRIRTLEELNDNKLIQEGRDVEYIGIINYSIIALMRLWYKKQFNDLEDKIIDEAIFELDEKKISDFYDNVVERVKELLLKKNHDYGEAWKEMEIYSLTDQILVKLLRIKNILRNDGKLQVSEDLDAQFSDILNYAVFAYIKLAEAKKSK